MIAARPRGGEGEGTVGLRGPEPGWGVWGMGGQGALP